MNIASNYLSRQVDCSLDFFDMLKRLSFSHSILIQARKVNELQVSTLGALFWSWALCWYLTRLWKVSQNWEVCRKESLLRRARIPGAAWGCSVAESVLWSDKMNNEVLGVFPSRQASGLPLQLSLTNNPLGQIVPSWRTQEQKYKGLLYFPYFEEIFRRLYLDLKGGNSILFFFY